MDRQSRHIVAAELEFSDMETGSDVEAQSLCSIDDAAGALDPADRAVEAGQYSVACCANQHAAVSFDLYDRSFIVSVQELSPTAISQLSGSRSRIDDVGEHDCGEHPIGVGPRWRRGSG